MRTVHWKLTAKTGEMIVREALVPCRARALLLVERRGGPDALDWVLEHLCWLSARLTQQGVSHTVLWPGENGVVHTALVDEAGQLDALLYRLLAEPADGADGWAPGWAPPQAEWSYTLRAEKEAADDFCCGAAYPPCPGARRHRKSRDALLAQNRPAQRSKKSAVVERAFQPFVVVAGRGRNGICRYHRL